MQAMLLSDDDRVHSEAEAICDEPPPQGCERRAGLMDSPGTWPIGRWAGRTKRVCAR